jgi:hypothetical protein
MLIVLLIAGLWMAQFPEVVLGALDQLGPALQRFADALKGPGAYFLPHHDTEPLRESRGARLAMRLFGIAIAALAFAGMVGVGR